MHCHIYTSTKEKVLLLPACQTQCALQQPPQREMAISLIDVEAAGGKHHQLHSSGMHLC